MKQENIFHPSGIVSNLSKTWLQKYSALKHVSEFKEKFNPGKLASTAKMEPKQIIFKRWIQQIVWILPSWTSFWWAGSSWNYRPPLPTESCTWCSALDERPFNCSICGKAFRSRPHALEHNAAIHSEVKSVTSVRKGLPRERDYPNASSPATKINLCAECDEYFVYKSRLGSHERKVHIVKCVEQEFHRKIRLSVICKTYWRKTIYL